MSPPCYVFFSYDSTLDSINFWLNRDGEGREPWSRPPRSHAPPRPAKWLAPARPAVSAGWRP